MRTTSCRSTSSWCWSRRQPRRFAFLLRLVSGASTHGAPLAAPIPPLARRHRYHGVLVPNAPWREQITADPNEQAHLAERFEHTVAEKAPSDTPDQAECKSLDRPRSRYRRVALLARIFEAGVRSLARLESLALAVDAARLSTRILAITLQGE